MIYKRNKTYHVDITVNGVRYRQSLGTKNWQEAQRQQKELIARILEGKAASPAGKGSFASLPLEQALEQFIQGRVGRVAARTTQIDRERAKVLRRLMGGVLVRKIDAPAIRTFQDARKAEGVSGRTINLEVTLIRQILKRAKRWSVIADDVENLPENHNVVGRVLTREQKLLLFGTAASKPEWDVAYCAAVVAANTTCRKVELLNLRWLDVDLFDSVLSIRRSKTAAGFRSIPLNDEARAAFGRLRRRAEAFGGGAPEHYVFPTCERGQVDFGSPQKGFRTAWRSLVKASVKEAGREAARVVLQCSGRIGAAKAAWKRAAQVFRGFRFHDLRHQAITELAEQGASDATVMALAGHLSRAMMEHYSHVRMAAKRQAVQALGGGLIGPEPDRDQATIKVS